LGGLLEMQGGCRYQGARIFLKHDLFRKPVRTFRDHALKYAAIAQLVEHVIRNDGVTGSNPVCGTTFSLRYFFFPSGEA
jgi:hypothetical protein